MKSRVFGLRSWLVVVSAAVSSGHFADPAFGQISEAGPRAFIGASLGLGMFGGESDTSDLLDVAPVLGMTFSHRFSSSTHAGLRVDGTLSAMSDSGARDGLNARTHLITLTVGPMLIADVGPLSPYVQPLIGGAASISHGTTISASGSGDSREVDETTYAFAYGLALGSHLLLGEGVHPLALNVGARLVDMSTLTFVRPDTDTFERDSSILELRFGVMLGL